MKETHRFCITCGKDTQHTLYYEDRIYDWDGEDVAYSEKGAICNVCGSENQTDAEWVDSIEQIRENRRHSC